MPNERHDIWKLLDDLSHEHARMGARLVAMRALVSGLDLPSPAACICRSCGVKCRGPRSLAQHVYVSHGGPLPEHVAAADKRAGVNE